MSDQPIPQEIDPVRGLVEALEDSEETIMRAAHLLEAIGQTTEADRLRAQASRDRRCLSTYRAWEEGGGPAERAEGGVRGRLQAPPSEGTTSAPADGEPSFTLVFAGDLTKFSKNPLRTDTPFGRPYAASIGNAFEELEALSSAALEAAGVDGAVTLSDPIPSLPASAPPEGWDFLTHLREANETRQRTWCEGGELPSGLFHATELGGEVGEVLNVVKKLEREAMGWRGSRATSDDLAQECADVLICLDKLAAHYGINLAEATAAKFNATSEKVGLPQRLSAAPPPPAGVDRPETEGEANPQSDEGTGQ